MFKKLQLAVMKQSAPTKGKKWSAGFIKANLATRASNNNANRNEKQ